jgi:hypothetical protein
MSTPIVEPEQPEQGPGATDQLNESEIDWKAKFEESQKHSRTWEQRAKDNKTAAEKLAALEESQKTAEQKTAERLAEAERVATEAQAKVLRRDVALDHKLTAEDATLLDTITDEDAMRTLAARLAAPAGRGPAPDPNQGKGGAGPVSTGDQFAAFFETQLGG